MGAKTNIEWCDATWNPWHGCNMVSPGCKNCYMFAAKRRYGQDAAVVVRANRSTFNLPLQRSRDGTPKLKAGSLVFTCSWSDWFHEAADPWRAEAWRIIRQRPDLLFVILTKRPVRMLDCLPPDWGNGYPNVVLGVSAEDGDRLEERYWKLRRVPAVHHAISFEPLLGPVSLDEVDRGWWEPKSPPLWSIIGGESGPSYRECDPAWIENLAREVSDAGHPLFVKQDAGPRPGLQGRISDAMWAYKERPLWTPANKPGGHTLGPVPLTPNDEPGVL